MTNTQAVSENHRPSLGLGGAAIESGSKTHRWVWWLASDNACLPPTTTEDATGMLTDDAVHEEDAWMDGCAEQRWMFAFQVRGRSLVTNFGVAGRLITVRMKIGQTFISLGVIVVFRVGDHAITITN
jgi:hypothetical protein